MQFGGTYTVGPSEAPWSGRARQPWLTAVCSCAPACRSGSLSTRCARRACDDATVRVPRRGRALPRAGAIMHPNPKIRQGRQQLLAADARRSSNLIPHYMHTTPHIHRYRHATGTYMSTCIPHAYTLPATKRIHCCMTQHVHASPHAHNAHTPRSIARRAHSSHAHKHTYTHAYGSYPVHTRARTCIAHEHTMHVPYGL